MKKSIQSLLIAASFAATASADPTVGNILVHQLWPWSQNIKVEYTLSGTGGATYDMNVTASEAGVAIPADKLSSALCGGEGFWGITGDGIHSFTLDPSKLVADGATALSDFTVSIAPGGPGDPRSARLEYRVFDLETGEVTDLRRRDIYAHPDLYGSVITNYADVGAGVTALDSGEVFIVPAFNTDAYKTTKLVMKRIPAANVDFWFGPVAGDTNAQDAAYSKDTNRRLGQYGMDARLSSDFWIGIHELTQKQYAMLMDGARPSNYSREEYWETRPLEHVSREEFLHSTTGLLHAASVMFGKTFQLPTEAQWEFAAKALYNDLNCYPGGLERISATYQSLEGYAWSRSKYASGSSYDKATLNFGTYPCGSGKPNPFGLYNMLGNVAEWCRDGARKNLDTFYSEQVAQGTVVDPFAETPGDPFGDGKSCYIVKGMGYNDSGAWLVTPEARRCEYATTKVFMGSTPSHGWRLVCPID